MIPTDDGQKELTVSVAATLDEKIMGLQGIASMPVDHGLLMVLDKPQPGTIWMKDTLMPLDVIFIAPDGRILNIFTDAKPGSKEHMKSAGEVMAVLEVNAGVASAWGFTPGQMLLPGLDADNPSFKGVAPENDTAKSIVDMIKSLVEISGTVSKTKEDAKR